MSSYFLPGGERGIRTLAAVSRPTPLAGAPLRPLEYFSNYSPSALLNNIPKEDISLALFDE